MDFVSFLLLRKALLASLLVSDGPLFISLRHFDDVADRLYMEFRSSKNFKKNFPLAWRPFVWHAIRTEFSFRLAAAPMARQRGKKMENLYTGILSFTMFPRNSMDFIDSSSIFMMFKY